MLYIKRVAAAWLLSTLFIATASATIIDTANSSYIDTDTGLEWMDFGINNYQSFNDVEANLATTWAGWSLATEEQVLTLWSNAFHDKGSSTDFESSVGGTYAIYSDYGDAGVGSVHEATFDAMGSLSIDFGERAFGWFEDDAGGLSYVHFLDATRFLSRDIVFAAGRGELNSHARAATILSDSTMLVRIAATSVPEPTSLGLLALGLALGFSRRKAI